MPTARVTFQKIIQDSLNYQSFSKNDDYMVSRIFFSLEVGGGVYDDGPKPFPRAKTSQSSSPVGARDQG